MILNVAVVFQGEFFFHVTDGEELGFCWRLGCGELPCDDIPHLLKYFSLFKEKMTYSVEKKWFFRRHSGSMKEVVAVVP